LILRNEAYIRMLDFHIIFITERGWFRRRRYRRGFLHIKIFSLHVASYGSSLDIYMFRSRSRTQIKD
jgi:hypothetical protein